MSYATAAAAAAAEELTAAMDEELRELLGESRPTNPADELTPVTEEQLYKFDAELGLPLFVADSK